MKNPFFLLALLVVPGWSACTHDVPCETDTVSFETEVLPILNANCSMNGCHSEASRADGVNLTTFQGVASQVRSGNAFESELYEVIVATDGDRMPPAPRTALTVEQINVIKTWIEQGGKNTNCP